MTIASSTSGLGCGIDFFPEDVVLIRAEPGFLEDGRVVRGDSSESTLIMSSHPAPGSQVDRLPEGLRNRDVRSFYARCDFIGADAPDGRPPDKLRRANGVTYEVQRSDDWSNNGGFYHALAVRLEVQP